MNENLNLVEILKDCPKGTKLYSTIYGEVKLCSVIEKCQYPIIFTEITGYTNKVTADGRHLVDYNGECTLFPSKEQRDWRKFTAPWDKKEQASLRVNDRAWLYLVSDVLTWKDGIGQYLDNPRVQELAKRLCSEYAQKLYNPSVLSNSSNTGKNKRKFDPKTLQPFDKVLCRAKIDTIWHCDLFSHLKNRIHICSGRVADYVVPYNDETKHLVGTAEEAPEFYRYWED